MKGGCEVIESLAHGRPVLCSTGAGAADAVSPGGRLGGETFPARDVAELARLVNFYKHEVDLQQIGQDGMATAAMYTWDKIRSFYVDVWKGML